MFEHISIPFFLKKKNCNSKVVVLFLSHSGMWMVSFIITKQGLKFYFGCTIHAHRRCRATGVRTKSEIMNCHQALPCIPSSSTRESYEWCIPVLSACTFRGQLAFAVNASAFHGIAVKDEALPCVQGFCLPAAIQFSPHLKECLIALPIHV